MKIKEVEGSFEEINNFFQNNGLNVAEYLNINTETKANKIWIYILIGLFVALNILVSLIDQTNKCFIPIAILNIGTLGGLIAIIQFNIEKWIVSTIVGIVGLLIMIVSFKVLSPKETIEKVKDKSEKYLDEKTKTEK